MRVTDLILNMSTGLVPSLGYTNVLTRIASHGVIALGISKVDNPIDSFNATWFDETVNFVESRLERYLHNEGSIVLRALLMHLLASTALCNIAFLEKVSTRECTLIIVILSSLAIRPVLMCLLPNFRCDKHSFVT